MTTFEIHQMQPADTEKAAEVLSYAMLHNPISFAVYQGESEIERQQIEGEFLSMLKDRPKDVFVAKNGNQIIGVCRFYTCHSNGFITQDTRDLLDTNGSDLLSVKNRRDYWKGIWKNHDPSIIHCHLGPLGVLPEYQNLGVGTLLMEHYCKLVDERKLPAYLETDSLTNVKFYRKFGFNLLDEIEILEVMNYFMWRETQS